MVTLGLALKEWQENDMEHFRYEYDLKPSDIVLDIGSYRREFANEIIKRYGCHVECFDALDNRAAWTHDGTLMMGGAYYYTSAYENESAQNEYRCLDIKPFLQREIALCKINIEGGEYDLMHYIIGCGLHINVKDFQVQFHQLSVGYWKEHYEVIAHDLSETHELAWRVPFVWENWRRKTTI